MYQHGEHFAGPAGPVMVLIITFIKGFSFPHFEKKLKRKKLKTQGKNSIRQHPFSNYVERGRGAI